MLSVLKKPGAQYSKGQSMSEVGGIRMDWQCLHNILAVELHEEQLKVFLPVSLVSLFSTYVCMYLLKSYFPMY